MKLIATSNADKLSELLKRNPEILRRSLAVAVGRSALEVSRDAKSHAPKAFSTLTNAITQTLEDGGLSAIVSANTDYAAMVEKGTGPGGIPSHQTILDWMRVKHIQPDQADDERDLAFLIRRKIAERGTPEQPFMQPAFDNNEKKIESRLTKAINNAIKELSL